MGTLLGGPGHRGVLRLAGASRSALDRPQLRHRSRLHDRSSAHARRDLAASRSRACPTPDCRMRTGITTKRPRCWPAKSSASSNRAGSTWSADAAARRPSISACWRRWCSGKPAARSRPTLRALGGLGNRDAGHRRGHAPGDRRRAHQRARQPQVQAAHRGRANSTRRPKSAARRCGAARTSLDVCLQDPDRERGRTT